MRATWISTLALAAASLAATAQEPVTTTKVECDGTTVVQSDAVDNRLDSTTQAPFHAIFDIRADAAEMSEGPLGFEAKYPAMPNPSRPEQLTFSAKDGSLTFFKQSGRFDLTRLKFSAGPGMGGDAMRTETTTGVCHAFHESHVFG
jgi:hypothetical protein